MPIPAGNVQWPPTPSPVLRQFQEWAAWYEGSEDELGRLYAGYTSAPARPAQFRGGIVGQVARWFWGQPTPPNEQRTKLHVPLPAEISSVSADQLFGEELDIQVTEGDRTRLDEILDDLDWHSTLLEAAEVASALGGVYLRITWDADVADHPLVTVVQADSAVPEFKFNRLVGVTFWQVVRVDGGSVWRHLEYHTAGRIEHALFHGTNDRLGNRVPLTEAEATAELEVDADSGVDTGYDGLTAIYVPNIRPTRNHRDSALGRSDYSGVEPLFDALDEAYSSLMREVRLGKARILIPRNQLRSEGPGEAATFDLDQEVFVELPEMAGSAKDAKLAVELMQPDLRIQQHLDLIRELKVEIVAGAGFSAQTFGLDNDTAVTATEIAAREKRTLVTREKKTRYWSRRLADLLEALTAVDAHVFGGGQPVRPTVVFPTAVQPTILELAQTAQALRTAEAASTESLVRMVHPDWDDQEVSDEVGRIKEDRDVQVTDPGAFGDPDGLAAEQLGMTGHDTTTTPE